VYWVGLPSLRGTKASNDAVYLNELFRARAEKAGINYIDVWDGFVDEGGRFSLHGPDFEGQTRRLRAGDGLHFTKYGARKIAHYVEREIRRSLSRGPVPVALPTSEPQSQPLAPQARPGGPMPRPLSGPVIPLTAAASGNEQLVGTAGAQNVPLHMTVSRVLVKGEPVDAPAGRSDDFAWPRRGVADFGADPVVASTTLPIPVMRAPPAATTVPVPSEDSPVVAAAPVRRASPQAQAQRQTQQQQTRGGDNNNFQSFFPFLFR
jgi:hypothetical protein